MKLRYFARVRDQIGTSTEDVALPPDVKTVEELVCWLRQRSAKHASTLNDLKNIRFAVNYDFAQLSDAINADDEIAIFPPVTGG